MAASPLDGLIALKPPRQQAGSGGGGSPTLSPKSTPPQTNISLGASLAGSRLAASRSSASRRTSSAPRRSNTSSVRAFGPLWREPSELNRGRLSPAPAALLARTLSARGALVIQHQVDACGLASSAASVDLVLSRNSKPQAQLRARTSTCPRGPPAWSPRPGGV